MDYNHTIAIFPHRTNGLEDDIFYELDVDADINEVYNINAGSYTKAPEYAGGSSVDSIYYKGIDVTDFVLSMIDEDDIIDAIVNRGCELESNRLKAALAA